MTRPHQWHIAGVFIGLFMLVFTACNSDPSIETTESFDLSTYGEETPSIAETQEEEVESATFDPSRQIIQPATDYPNRPQTVDDVHMATFHQDDPSIVAGTGNPQLLIFYTITDNSKVCITPGCQLPQSNRFACANCQFLLPVLQPLEAEYWGQVDFVHINFSVDDMPTNQILEYYNVNVFGKPTIIFVTAEGDVIRNYRTNQTFNGTGLPTENDYRVTFDRHLAEIEEGS